MNADAVADALELDVDDVPICLACLSFVSFAIDSGDEREIRRWTMTMTPDLWEEGLALPARLAVERAAARGVAGAADALAELRARGPRSRVARAIVRRLNAQLSERAQGDLLKMGSEPFPPWS
ncbi:MAG TPA: hypothetical protein VE261_02055 [Gaiellaceae bacterium]|nr:hypothetical protein [Gaiellaceae bacterium]